MKMKIGPKTLKNRNHVRKWWVIEDAVGWPRGGHYSISVYPCRRSAALCVTPGMKYAPLSPSHMSHARAGRIA